MFLTILFSKHHNNVLNVHSPDQLSFIFIEEGSKDSEDKGLVIKPEESNQSRFEIELCLHRHPINI